jgi:hypothetical protein
MPQLRMRNLVFVAVVLRKRRCCVSYAAGSLCAAAVEVCLARGGQHLLGSLEAL